MIEEAWLIYLDTIDWSFAIHFLARFLPWKRQYFLPNFFQEQVVLQASQVFHCVMCLRICGWSVKACIDGCSFKIWDCWKSPDVSSRGWKRTSRKSVFCWGKKWSRNEKSTTPKDPDPSKLVFLRHWLLLHRFKPFPLEGPMIFREYYFKAAIEIPVFCQCILESTSTFLCYWRVCGCLRAKVAPVVVYGRTVEPGFVDAAQVSCINHAIFQ